MIGTNFIARAALLAGTAMAFAGDAGVGAGRSARPSAEAVAAAAAARPTPPPAVDSGEIVVTARRRAESLQDVPIAVTAYSGEQLEKPGRARHHRHQRHHAQRHARDLARHQHHADRLHPRRRPAGSGRRLRSGRRPLPRRRLSQPPAGRGARHLRRRADRSAARAAGHAVRPQHDRRGDQICHPPPAQPHRRQPARQPRHLQPGRPDRLGQHAAQPTACASARAFARLGREGFGDNLVTGASNYNKDIFAARGTIEFEPSDGLLDPRVGRLHRRPERGAQRPPPDRRPAHRRADPRRRLRHPRRADHAQAAGPRLWRRGPCRI